MKMDRCSDLIKKNYSLSRQSSEYIKLYTRLIQEHKNCPTDLSFPIKILDKETREFLTESRNTLEYKEKHEIEKRKECAQYDLILKSKWVRLGGFLGVLHKP